MISLDEVNEEWKKQDARLDAFRSKAKLMHDSLLKEVESLHYDIFKREESELQDTLPIISKGLVEKDGNLRKDMKGPTIVKEKFHSSYWKGFNTERDLLEEISRQQLMKTLQQQRNKSLKQDEFAVEELSPLKSKRRNNQSSRKGLTTHTAGTSTTAHKKLESTSAKGYEIYKGDYINRNWKSAVFASPTHLQNDLDETPFFDSHLLGRNNSIDQLMKLSNARSDVSNYNEEKVETVGKESRENRVKKETTNSMFDPNDIGNSPLKGGAMARDRQRPKTTDTITKLCDIPDLANSLKTVKGGPFLQEPRFTSTQAAADTAYNPKPQSIPGANPKFKFSLSKRFATKEEEESKTLLATPGPANYEVSSLTSTSHSIITSYFEQLCHDRYPGYLILIQRRSEKTLRRFMRSIKISLEV